MPTEVPHAGQRQHPPAGIGLGCVTFGREIDRPASFAMMDHAITRGISFFDTASAYGGGASETILGEWLRERGTRASVVLATKILPPYQPAAIEAAVAASLARLGVEFVDVLFVHRWDQSIIQPATLRVLDRLVRDGRVRALGASNFSGKQLVDALAMQTAHGLTKFSVLQNIHNVAVRGFDAPTIALCAREAVAMIGYSPLGAGFLTGKHEQGVQPGTRFDLIPGHQNVYFNESARARLARLRETSRQSGIPMTTLALAWALHSPHLDTILVGGRTEAHLDQAFAARTFADLSLLAALDTD